MGKVNWTGIDKIAQFTDEDIDNMSIDEVRYWSKIAATFFGGDGTVTLAELADQIKAKRKEDDDGI